MSTSDVSVFRHISVQEEPTQDAVIITFVRTHLAADATNEIFAELKSLEGRQKVIINMRNLDYIEDRAFHALIEFQLNLKATGGFVLLCSVAPEIMHRLDVLNRNDTFRVCWNVEHALRERD